MIEFVVNNLVSVCVFVAILGTIIYLYSQFFFVSGPNPFSIDVCKKQVQPLITDQKARDKIIKQGFQAKLVPEDLDAVVIGSGIGGLTAAAILARAGKKVLVLEQHDQAGGCCHTFIDKGFEYDVGIHYVGEMNSNTVNRLLVDQITDGQLQWNDLDDEFDVIALGKSGSRKFYPMKAGGYRSFRTNLLKMFPKEEKAIDKFIALIKECRRQTIRGALVQILPKWIVRILISSGLLNLFTSYFTIGRRTLKEVLDEITDDADLKAVLSYCWGDYGCPPSKGSFVLHAALVNHFMQGASYPIGGSSQIALTIIPVIERAGGKVLVRAPVTSILTDENGNVNGVQVGRSSGPVDIRAPLVISDAGIVNTFTRLLPTEIAQKSSIHQLLTSGKVESGVSCMSVFVGLRGTTQELGIKSQNIWSYVSNDLDGLMNDLMSKESSELSHFDIPLLFLSFPSTKDPTYQERYPCKTMCTLVTMAKWEWFERWKNDRVMKRGEDYESLKKTVADKMWKSALEFYPQLADKVEYFEVGTPVTNNYYLNTPRGEIYGLEHNTTRFGNPEIAMNLRANTGIPGLMLTGQDIVSCGFTGALLGGLMCASSVLKRNLYGDLAALRKQLRKAK